MTGMESNWTQISLQTPGKEFADSFLLGNGRMGVSLGFQPEKDSVLLSHAAFWSGAPPKTHGRPGAPEAFRAARAFSMQGDPLRAYEALKGFIGEKENYGTNLPVGRLRMEQYLPGWEDYRRCLSLTEGEARCDFRCGTRRQTRRARCLQDPSVLEMEFRDTEPMRIAFSMEGTNIFRRTVAENRFLFEAQALETVHSDGTCGVFLAGGFVLSADGAIRAGKDSILAEGHVIRLRLTMETEDPPEAPESGNPPQKVRRVLDAFPHAAADRETPAKDLLSPRIEIEGETRINRQALTGHYLLRAAAAPDSPLPPNLQGVWNDEEACRLGWTNDYHLDVNTQMNLWCAETLGEGHRLAPLFRFMLDRLIPEGRKTARGYYGLPGAVAELSTNCFGYAAPYWGRPLAPCPGCGFWLCGLVIRHALCHPEDRVFPAETALPILRPFVEFAVAYVTEDESGVFQGGPSVSPENGFRAGEKTVYAAMGTTFENEQLRMLLDGYVKICRMLHRTEEAAKQAAEILDRLPPLRINQSGEISEYAHDPETAVPHHRHMSHLSGLYPGWEIRPEKRELAEAAEKTIRARIQPENAFESTPWARVMLGLYEARLGHGDRALEHLETMMAQHGSDTLLMMHPAIPGTQNPRPVWELDGNTGFTEVVLEMLAQAPEDRLLLLPALPARWKKGRVRGIQAGPWTLAELEWETPGRVEVRLRGLPGATPEIHWNQRRIRCRIPESGELRLNQDHFLRRQ